MTNSLPLLEVPHSQALPIMTQELLIPGVDVSNLGFSTPEIQPNGEVRQPVFIRAEAYDDPSWPYVGEVTITHKRVDLTQAFGPLRMTYRSVSGTFTVRELLDYLQLALGVVFETADFFNESVTFTSLSHNYRLRSSATSKRWQGGVDVMIYR